MPDAPELQWALTWRSTNDSAAIRALARTAADFGPIQLWPDLIDAQAGAAGKLSGATGSISGYRATSTMGW
jgi:hypothetical protein